MFSKSISTTHPRCTAFCRAKWDRLPESGSSWYKQYGGACNVLKSGWFNSPCSCSSSRSPGTWWCPGGRASPPVPVPRLKFHCALRDSDVNNIFTLAQSSLTAAMLPEMQARWTGEEPKFEEIVKDYEATQSNLLSLSKVKPAGDILFVLLGVGVTTLWNYLIKFRS